MTDDPTRRPMPDPTHILLPVQQIAEAPITREAAVAWLEEAARYFANRDTRGEDAAHWANVANSETAKRIGKLIQGLADAVGERVSEFPTPFDALPELAVGQVWEAVGVKTRTVVKIGDSFVVFTLGTRGKSHRWHGRATFLAWARRTGARPRS